MVAEQSLITVESNKASIEIPSSHAGVVKEMLVKIGERISEGSLLAIVETSGGAPAPAGAGVARPPHLTAAASSSAIMLLL